MRTEFDAGNGQSIVVYTSADTGNEIDPSELYAVIAADSAVRAAAGERIVSMTSTALRHSQVAFGREGSGFQSKFAIAVVFARS